MFTGETSMYWKSLIIKKEICTMFVTIMKRGHAHIREIIAHRITQNDCVRIIIPLRLVIVCE